jgi:hypothetical protein
VWVRKLVRPQIQRFGSRIELRPRRSRPAAGTRESSARRAPQLGPQSRFESIGWLRSKTPFANWEIGKPLVESPPSHAKQAGTCGTIVGVRQYVPVDAAEEGRAGARAAGAASVVAVATAGCGASRSD